MTLQKTPPELYTHVHTDFMPNSAYRVPVIDLMVLWGYSKTVARSLLKEGRVFVARQGEAAETCIVDFLGSPQELVLFTQKGCSEKYWSHKSRALVLHARRLSLLERTRLWAVRHLPGFDREGLLPRAGSLVPERNPR